jgi:hypothetical protein
MDITDSLFDWVSRDEVCNDVLTFHNCTLKVPIGPFKTGEVVEVILVDFEHGHIQLLDDPTCTGIRGHTLMHEQKICLALVD